jgi:D-3-phosphoglycerate dehydrogenase
MTHRVVFTDNVPDTLDIEREILNEADITIIDGERAKQPIEDLVAGADALISSQQIIDGAFMDRMPDCRVISRTGIGVDYIDLEAATERGILVTNVPDHCISEVSDHALGLMLAIKRRIVEYDSDVRQGSWNRTSKPIHRIDGQTLGIVGYGKTGQELGKKAQALGMEALTTEYPDKDTVHKHGAVRVPFEDLLARSDVVSLHVPLTEETTEIIGREELETMKESAVLINTARGGVVDQTALTDALEKGAIGGAGLDVLCEEPPSPDNPLLDLDSVIFTPHVGYYSIESRRELRKRVVENVRTVLTGDIPEHVVNEAVLDKIQV